MSERLWRYRVRPQTQKVHRLGITGSQVGWLPFTELAWHCKGAVLSDDVKRMYLRARDDLLGRGLIG
jgi:hypothetical protein